MAKVVVERGEIEKIKQRLAKVFEKKGGSASVKETVRMNNNVRIVFYKSFSK